MMRLQPLPGEFRSSASALLVVAVFSNPAHIYVCPSAEKRLKQLEWMLGANLNIQLDLGVPSFCNSDDEGVVAMDF